MSFLSSALVGLSRRICSTQLTVPLRAITSTGVPKNLQQTAASKSQGDEQRREIFRNVNRLVQDQNEGRLFAVVQLAGKQFKVTNGDIIVVEGAWPPATGDKIRLDKVLLAGCNDFTLIGRPLLDPGLVDVQATVIEKTLSHTKTHFRKKRRKQYMRIHFMRAHNTMLRINSIAVRGDVNGIAADPTSTNRIFGQ